MKKKFITLLLVYSILFVTACKQDIPPTSTQTEEGQTSPEENENSQIRSLRDIYSLDNRELPTSKGQNPFSGKTLTSKYGGTFIFDDSEVTQIRPEYNSIIFKYSYNTESRLLAFKPYKIIEDGHTYDVLDYNKKLENDMYYFDEQDEEGIENLKDEYNLNSGASIEDVKKAHKAFSICDGGYYQNEYYSYKINGNTLVLGYFFEKDIKNTFEKYSLNGFKVPSTYPTQQEIYRDYLIDFYADGASLFLAITSVTDTTIIAKPILVGKPADFDGDIKDIYTIPYTLNCYSSDSKDWSLDITIGDALYSLKFCGFAE